MASESGLSPWPGKSACARCRRTVTGGLGTLYRQIGRAALARTALSTAIALYRAMDMTFWLPAAEAALVQVERQ